MATFKVTVPMTAEELERKLYRIIWESVRSKAATKAKNELARVYHEEFSKLVSRELDQFSSGEITIQEL